MTYVESQEPQQFPEEPGEESKAGITSMWLGMIFGFLCPTVLIFLFMIGMFGAFEGADWPWFVPLVITLLVLTSVGCLLGTILAIKNLLEDFSQKWAGKIGLLFNGGGLSFLLFLWWVKDK